MSGYQGRSPLRKPHKTLTRRALLSINEREERSVSEDLRFEILGTLESIDKTVHELRRLHGISLPHFKLEWDPVPIESATPARTIEAYQGNRGAVRVTLMLDNQADDTTDEFLQMHGVSHLIGIDIEPSCSQPACLTNVDGGMLARIKTSLEHVAWILHDVFIDMAMVHAAGQIWSGIRGTMTAIGLASQKASFARSRLSTLTPLLSISPNTLYVPICTLARTGLTPADLRLDRCVELWTQFAVHLSQTGAAAICYSRADMVDNVLRQHINGGQISRRKLTTRFDALEEGHYRFYFLERGARKLEKKRDISQFFNRNPEHFRTQWWTILRKGEKEKAAKLLVSEGFVSEYPFYIGV